MLKDKSSWLDRPLLAAVTLDREKALYALFIALAVLSRLWDLGFRVFSHDETVHARWAWNLYQGGPHGYEHHPLSHGPFLFNVTALLFYLFGDNDVTARLTAALLGIVLVAAPYTLRRWLGRSGALVASFLFLISPSMLYYSRYDRNDVPIVLWSLITVLAMFKYLETRLSRENLVSRTRWLLTLAVALSLMFATKEVSFIYIAIFGLFLVFLFFARLGAPRRSSLAWGQWKGLTLTTLGLLGILALALGLFLFSLNLVELFPLRYRDCAQASEPEVAPGQTGCASGCKLIQGRCQRLIPIIADEHVMEFDQSGAQVAIRLTRVEILVTVALISFITLLTGVSVYLLLERLMPFQGGQRPALDLILFTGTFTLPFLAPIAINGLSRLASRALFGVDAAFEAMDYSEAGLLRSAGFVFAFLAVSVAVGLWWDWRRWLVSAGVFYVIFVVLFTNVFTNGNGLASGMVGSLAYWLEQQAVERGDQPLYCYVMWVSLYDYLPLTGFLASLLYVLTGRSKPKDPPPTPESSPSSTVHRPSSLFPLFLFFWTALSWFAYTVAGERMPWMAVHIVAPMILASGWIVGKLIEGSDWRAIMRRGGWLVLLVAPVGWAALVQTVSPWLATAGARPFSGRSLSQLEATQKFMAAALVLAVSLLALRWAWERVGGDAFKRTLLALALVLLAVLTIRTAWIFAYVNPDNASEFLVFAHGAPDVRYVMAQVEDISRRSSGALSLPLAYTADGSYPFIWYLRNYPNATQLPNPPSGPALDKPVIIAGDAEWGGIQPYLGDNYVCNRHNFMWWPMQDYYDLSWERVRYALTNPEMRAAVWDVAFRRDYSKYEQASGKTVRLSEWPLRDGFHFCVRRDIVAQVWREGAGPAEFGFLVDEAEMKLPDYVALERFVEAELELKDALQSPHGMALDAEGFLYVADTDNHRIVKFSSQGEVVDTWDSTWWHGLESWQPGGCLDADNRPLALDDGEFCEPWGVAVGPEGRVYVADTWNHRVQVFDAEGRFLGKVGVFGQAGASVSSAPDVFYGPRDVVVDGEGRVYVSDTGNKRIQVFAPYEDLDPDLNYLTSLGGPGIIEGRLDEPVGLAIGADGLLYVADTWNRRVQVLTLEGTFVRQWPMGGWESQSPANKPYLADDGAGRIYVSDPEGMRVVVFDAQGTPLVALKGAGESFFRLPVGVLVDGEGRLWVSDAAGDRVLRFGGVE
jgi:uncharacterized protein (TIGR03663 family)